MKWLLALVGAAAAALAAAYRIEDPFLKRHPYPTGPIKGRPGVPPDPRMMRYDEDTEERLLRLRDQYRNAGSE